MIETDPRLKKTLALVSARAKLPLDKMVERAVEVLRTTRSPKPSSVAIIEARRRLSNDRSSIIEDRLFILQELHLIKRQRSELESYLIAKYSTGFLSNVKNARTRDAMVDSALVSLTRIAGRLESALEALNIVIGDLDSRAFSIRDVMEALKLGERESGA